MANEKNIKKVFDLTDEEIKDILNKEDKEFQELIEAIENFNKEYEKITFS